MYTSEKNTKQLTVRGGVNPCGQPDRKISGFFFDGFPKWTPKRTKHCYRPNVTNHDQHGHHATNISKEDRNKGQQINAAIITS